RPAVLHCDIAALDTVGFFETMPDRVERAGFTIGAVKQADHRHRRLLRPRRGRPRDRRATEHRDEIAPVPHSITSPGRHRNDPGIVRPSALAVVRFTTRSNLVGCSTGMSPGFAPRRILST